MARGPRRAPAASRPRSAAVAVAPARRCAYTVVRRVFERGAYADRALRACAGELGARDRALAMRLAYGTVQRRATLDHLVEILAERPPERLDAPLLAALRLGLYELAYLAGAPDRAVVSDSVELAKLHSRHGHELVNAVLRRAAREGVSERLARLPDGTPAEAALKHSHPLWLAQLWWEQLGADQARQLMAANNTPGELAVRANTLVGGVEELAAELGVPTRRDPELPEALVLLEAVELHSLPAFARGAFIAQSRAAMLAAAVVEPQPGERVLDLCAAPGGKATHLAALMGGEGEVLAVERNARRAAELQRTVGRMHAENVTVQRGDARVPRPSGERFDRVLVDPPCSGLGTLQAHPDLRWRANPASIAEMAEDQALMLSAGARALRPGGVLVYSTCTVSPAENERLITAFLAANPDFEIDDLAAQHPAHVMPRSQRPGDPALAGALLTLPHRDRTAGFFIARLHRR